MRPVFAVLALLMLTLSACTIREETFAPRDDAGTGGFSLGSSTDLGAPASRESRPCPGGLARGSDIQTARDGTQDLFCD
jgi:hypothetical protein